MLRSGDYDFQKKCSEFVFEQLGASSDDAAAYYCCSECGARWGFLPALSQSDRTYCTVCFQSCHSVPVEAIHPKWKTESVVSVADKGAVKEIELVVSISDHPDPVQKYGKALYDLSLQARDNAGHKSMRKCHVDKAIELLQASGVELSYSELKHYRKVYRDRVYKENIRKKK